VRLRLMIDLNVGMDRTGIAPGDDAFELLWTMCRLPGIIPAGLHAYDGHLRDADDETLEQKVEAAFEPVWRLRDRCRQAGMTIDRLVASGTPTSHLLARHDDVEVSAGTTVLWDAGQLRVTPSLPYQVAAVVLTRVISRPARDLICIDLGHKAIASEFKPPRVQLFGLDAATFVSHSEEHMVLRTELADRNPPGTVLYGLPFHICPTMALHASVWGVRNQIAAESWRVAARDRCLTV
ncbi:MAG: alanine racemase, partial [Planctomycetota bacterium]